MKVRVNFTVEVDPELWELNFGTDRALIRQDVKDFVEQAAKDQLINSGVAREP